MHDTALLTWAASGRRTPALVVSSLCPSHELADDGNRSKQARCSTVQLQGDPARTASGSQAARVRNVRRLLAHSLACPLEDVT